MSDELTVRVIADTIIATGVSDPALIAIGSRVNAALGLPPDMTVAELRTMLALGKHMLGEQQTDIMADLAIAKRARETEEAFAQTTTFTAAAWAGGYNACRDHTLGSTT